MKPDHVRISLIHGVLRLVLWLQWLRWGAGGRKGFDQDVVDGLDCCLDTVLHEQNQY